MWIQSRRKLEWWQECGVVQCMSWNNMWDKYANFSMIATSSNLGRDSCIVVWWRSRSHLQYAGYQLFGWQYDMEWCQRIPGKSCGMIHEAILGSNDNLMLKRMQKHLNGMLVTHKLDHLFKQETWASLQSTMGVIWCRMINHWWHWIWWIVSWVWVTIKPTACQLEL